MNTCRACGSPYKPFHSFGRQPLANGFLEPKQYSKEYFFEMAVGCCENCFMFQLIEQPDPKAMFHDNYAFFSGTSKAMGVHFEEFANEIHEKFLKIAISPFIVELGSNDGIFLKHFAAKKVKHLGVEPSENVANVARAQGVNTFTKFFGVETAKEIRNQYGAATALTAANCLCHIPDINSLIGGMAILLDDNGVVVFEDPYLGDVIEKTSYDQIYDEHVFLFSLHSVAYAYARHGFELFDVKKTETHGGSMRYYLCRKGKRPQSAAVKQWMKHEEEQGLGKAETYRQFGENCETSKKELVALLTRLKKEKKRVVGYAATSKSTTVLNYCNIGPELIEFISDTTPLKQGKFSPGKHIPVLAYEEFKQNPPDFALLLGWNHRKEILAKEKDFAAHGGQWIVYVPHVEITCGSGVKE